MTNEERLALVGFLKFLVDGSAGQHLTIYQIALASLQAEPVGYIDPTSLREYRGHVAGGSWSQQPKTGEYNQSLPIYTTPPAPAIEPVSQPYKLNSPAIPDGWQLVPKELTQPMLSAWINTPRYNGEFAVAYQAMLSAAPGA